MRMLVGTPAPIKTALSPAEARTAAALLTTIAAALDGDGSFIEPGSIDTQGLAVVAWPYRWRLELLEPELLEPTGPEPDRDWMSDTGQDLEF